MHHLDLGNMLFCHLVRCYFLESLYCTFNLDHIIYNYIIHNGHFIYHCFYCEVSAWLYFTMHDSPFRSATFLLKVLSIQWMIAKMVHYCCIVIVHQIYNFIYLYMIGSRAEKTFLESTNYDR